MSDVDALRAKLQHALDAKGQSAFWLSGRAKVGANTVGNFLSERTHNLRAETWEKIARALDWDVASTLAAAGYGAPAPLPADPVGQFDVLLQQLGAEEEDRQAIMWAVRKAVPAPAAVSTSDVPQ